MVFACGTPLPCPRYPDSVSSFVAIDLPSRMTAPPAFTTLGAGPTILMLHDLFGGHLSFAPQVETFAGAGYRAVAWDMPGYGRSAPVEPYGFKGLAQCCADLIDGLRCGSVILIGHGMGGMVAQELVARRPELVSRLVLCASLAQGSRIEGALAGEETPVLADGETMAQLADFHLPRLTGPGALPEGLGLARHAMGQVSPVTYRRAAEASAHFNRQAELSRIHVPTLLVGGEFDRLAPAEPMHRMADAVGASATVAVLRGVGHWPQLEAPDDFDGAVLGFLSLPRLLH